MNRISIIIPHYNSWKMLRELLETIPKNGMYEIIVVDDHTKDNLKHLKKLSEQYPEVTFLLNDDNKKGAGAARNKGLQHASGAWLLFADADDKFLSDFTSILEPYLESDYEIVFFTPTSFFESKEADSLRHQTFERYIDEYLESEDVTKEYTMRFNFSPPWSKLVKRDLVERHGIKFDETKVANDVMFSAKIGNHAQQIIASRKKIYAVRQMAGSITSVVSEENFRIRFDVWVELINYMQDNIGIIEFKKMNISVIPQLLQVVQNRLGIRNIWYVIKQGINNKIPLIDKRIFNVEFILNSIKQQKKLKDSNKRTTINKL